MVVVGLCILIIVCLIGLLFTVAFVRSKNFKGTLFSILLIILGGTFGWSLMNNTKGTTKPEIPITENSEDADSESNTSDESISDVHFSKDKDDIGDVGEEGTPEDKIPLSDTEVLKRIPSDLQGTGYVDFSDLNTMLLDGDHVTTWILLYNLADIRKYNPKVQIRDFRVSFVQKESKKTYVYLKSLYDDSALENGGDALNFCIYLDVSNLSENVEDWIGHRISCDVDSSQMYFVVDNKEELKHTYKSTDDEYDWSPMAIPVFKIENAAQLEVGSLVE